MKAQIRLPERTDAQEGPTSGPTLTRLRGRGESHLLMVMSLAAATFIALMIAKPWGGNVRSPEPPTAASIAAASVTSQPTAFIAIRPGASEASPQGIVVQPGEVTALTVTCADPSSAWQVVAASAEPLIGLQQITWVMVCTDSNLVQLRVLYQPEP